MEYGSEKPALQETHTPQQKVVRISDLGPWSVVRAVKELLEIVSYDETSSNTTKTNGYMFTATAQAPLEHGGHAYETITLFQRTIPFAVGTEAERTRMSEMISHQIMSAKQKEKERGLPDISIDEHNPLILTIKE